MVQRRKETFYFQVYGKKKEEDNEISNIEHNQLTGQTENIHFKMIKVY